MRRTLPAALLLTAALGCAAAHVRAQLWLIADELSALTFGQADESSLIVNGARLQLVTLTATTSVRGVLDTFAAHCAREADPALARAASMLRQESADGGVAVCLARSESALERTLSERARAYARSGDLCALGQLRYVRARRTAHGSVHVLFAYSAGPLPVAAMFPAHGDAAGSDMVELPRPRAARRLLSAQLSSSPHGMVAYEATEPASVALTEYAHALERNGFVQLQVAPRGSSTRAFSRGEQLYVVHARARGAGSVLSAVRVGRALQAQPLPAAGTALAEVP